MALNIKNDRVEQLAAELARITGETKTAVILRALEERRDRVAVGASGKRRLEHAIDFMEKEVWPNIPRKFLGRRVTKKEREQILGYGKSGV
jgi:antitoxin VapB